MVIGGPSDLVVYSPMVYTIITRQRILMLGRTGGRWEGRPGAGALCPPLDTRPSWFDTAVGAEWSLGIQEGCRYVFLSSALSPIVDVC